MPHPVETHQIVQYSTNVNLLLQQRGSKLRGLVSEGQYRGKQASPVDQIAPVATSRRTTRAQPIVWSPANTDRRWVFPLTDFWSDGIDQIDKLKMIVDPMSAYVQNGAYAMGRFIDDCIIDAAFADAKTGEAAGTTTSFLAGNQVAVNFGSASNTNISVAKLKEARRILRAHEVDLEMDPITAIINASAETALLNEIEIVSKEFNDKPVLVDGKLTRWLGINFVHCERLDTDGSGYYRIPVFAKSGMHLGVWDEVKTDVSQRNDLTGLPWQVYVEGTFGATRTEEKKVVELKCNQS